MLILQPDPDAPIYESVRRGEVYRLDVEARRNAEEAGYRLGRGILRFSQVVNGWAAGYAKAQAEAVPPEEEGETDDDDHYA